MSSEYEHKNYQRNNKGDDSNGPRKESIDKIVRDLIKTEKNDYSVLAQLRAKYGNDQKMVEAVFDGFKDRKEFIDKKARKFKQLMFDRYSRHNLTFPQLMKKARKYKARYDLSEDEFEVFMLSALNDKAYSSQAVNLPNTAMSKTLGYAASVATGEKLNVKDNELDTLQEILRIHGETRPLHANVTLQSLTYRDCASEALNGIFNPERHNPYSYVHPVVAALFLPRIRYLDEHMLIANLAHIIKLKHEGQSPLTKPEFEVYWDLITDPNDTVCDTSSPLKDLRNRVILQTRLWDSVLNLRQGKYYNDRLVEFLLAIDSCRNNIYDVPDLTYVKDEGAIVRRLLSAFSLRPTIVTTSPLYGLISNNPHINPNAVSQVTTVPMINLRLPLNVYNTTTPIALSTATQQAHWYVEGKMLVPKSQSIMYSRDVMFFYVGRRYQMINVGRLVSPYNYQTMPMTVSGLARLNNRQVDYEPTMSLRDGKTFELRSVIFVDVATQVQSTDQLIIGTSAGVVVKKPNGARDYVLYDPQSVAAGIVKTTGGTGTNPPTSPTSMVDRNHPVRTFGTAAGTGEAEFKARATQYGTVFVYVRTDADAPVSYGFP